MVQSWLQINKLSAGGGDNYTQLLQVKSLTARTGQGQCQFVYLKVLHLIMVKLIIADGANKPFHLEWKAQEL